MSFTIKELFNDIEIVDEGIYDNGVYYQTIYSKNDRKYCQSLFLNYLPLGVYLPLIPGAYNSFYLCDTKVRRSNSNIFFKKDLIFYVVDGETRLSYFNKEQYYHASEYIPPGSEKIKLKEALDSYSNSIGYPDLDYIGATLKLFDPSINNDNGEDQDNTSKILDAIDAIHDSNIIPPYDKLKKIQELNIELQNLTTRKENLLLYLSYPNVDYISEREEKKKKNELRKVNRDITILELSISNQDKEILSLIDFNTQKLEKEDLQKQLKKLQEELQLRKDLVEKRKKVANILKSDIEDLEKEKDKRKEEIVSLMKETNLLEFLQVKLKQLINYFR